MSLRIYFVCPVHIVGHCVIVSYGHVLKNSEKCVNRGQLIYSYANIAVGKVLTFDGYLLFTIVVPCFVDKRLMEIVLSQKH